MRARSNATSRQTGLPDWISAAGFAVLAFYLLSKLQVDPVADLTWKLITRPDATATPLQLIGNVVLSGIIDLGLLTVLIFAGLKASGFTTKCRPGRMAGSLFVLSLTLPVLLAVLYVGVLSADSVRDALPRLFFARGALLDLAGIMAALGAGALLLNQWFDVEFRLKRRARAST